jgi:hypothetical protein
MIIAGTLGGTQPCVAPNRRNSLTVVKTALAVDFDRTRRAPVDLRVAYGDVANQRRKPCS